MLYAIIILQIALPDAWIFQTRAEAWQKGSQANDLAPG